MGISIINVIISGSRFKRSYLFSGAKVIKKGIRSDPDIPVRPGMIINTGVYPDKYIQEPAFASLLLGRQKVISDENNSDTFSFDLHEGGGGLIMALRILKGFLESKKIDSGLVVAGDHLKHAHAGAIFLSNSTEIAGFSRFHQEIYVEYQDEYRSYTRYLNGELKLVIDQSDKYIDNCQRCAEKSLTKFLDTLGLSLIDIDLFITSQSPFDFAPRINETIGGNRVEVIKNSRHLNSAGMIFALNQAIESGRFKQARIILFMTVGPGITIDMALYENG
jgi:3-oxoacyl-[acyl-carrier-protein] synthase III